jgi:hypothetical protein
VFVFAETPEADFPLSAIGLTVLHNALPLLVRVYSTIRWRASATQLPSHTATYDAWGDLPYWEPRQGTVNVNAQFLLTS